MCKLGFDFIFKSTFSIYFILRKPLFLPVSSVIYVCRLWILNNQMKLYVYEGWARNCRKGLVITLKPLRFWIVPQENYSYIPCSITSLWELLGVTWWLIWLIRSSMKCQRIDDLSIFFSVASHWKKVEKNAPPSWPISEHDSSQWIVYLPFYILNWHV